MAKGTRISEDETLAIIKDFKEGLNTVELGEKYNRNNTTIGSLLKRNGLKARNETCKLTKQQVLEAYEKYEKELWTTEKLGLFYSVDANTIANSFRRYGLLVRPNGWIPELKKDDWFSIIDSEEKAYFLGFLMCDGSIINDKNHLSLHLEIQERDKYILEEFVRLLELSKNRVKTYKRTEKNLTTSKISINSDRLCQDLISKGVIRKKVGFKKIPSDVPEHLLHHTIRGMFDADGGISKENKTVSICGGGTMTEEIASVMKDKVSLEKEPWTYIDKRSEKNPKWRDLPIDSFTGENDFLQVCNYLYKDATIYLHRKNPF